MKKVLLISALVLIVSQTYAQNGTETLRKFINAKRSIFLSEGLKKSHGLKIRLEYPDGWSNRDGKRTHVLQFFKSPQLFEMASIGVIPFQDISDYTGNTIDFVRKNKNDFYTEDFAYQSLNVNEQMQISNFKHKLTYLDGIHKASYAECMTSGMGNGDIAYLEFYNRFYIVLHDDNIIMIHLMIQRHTNETDLAYKERINEWKPVLDLIINSFTILY